MKLPAPWVIVLVGLACSRANRLAPSEGAPATAPVSPPPASRTTPSVDARPDAKAEPAEIVPLAAGSRLRLEGIGGTDSGGSGDDPPVLEITVPPKFKLKMHSSDDELPSAHLKGGGLEVVVEAPEAGFTTLAETEASLSGADRGATFIHAAETPDGHLLVYQSTVPGIGPRFGVVVSRPRLKVHCGAHALTQLPQAERAASICLTLRVAPGESGP